MLENIRRNYGEYLCTVLYIPAAGTIPQKSSVIESSNLGSWVVIFVDDGQEGDKLYSFPVPKSLAEASEEDLKKLGMGNNLWISMILVKLADSVKYRVSCEVYHPIVKAR